MARRRTNFWRRWPTGSPAVRYYAWPRGRGGMPSSWPHAGTPLRRSIGPPSGWRRPNGWLRSARFTSAPSVPILQRWRSCPNLGAASSRSLLISHGSCEHRFTSAFAQDCARGGVFIAESYTPKQVEYGTGGPKDPGLLPTLNDLRQELAGLEWEIAREVEREIHEGELHDGWSAVVQVLARKR